MENQKSTSYICISAAKIMNLCGEKQAICKKAIEQAIADEREAAFKRYGERSWCNWFPAKTADEALERMHNDMYMLSNYYQMLSCHAMRQDKRARKLWRLAEEALNADGFMYLSLDDHAFLVGEG